MYVFALIFSILFHKLDHKIQQFYRNVMHAFFLLVILLLLFKYHILSFWLLDIPL